MRMYHKGGMYDKGGTIIQQKEQLNKMVLAQLND